MNRLLTDLRYGVRMLRKTPGASFTVLVALSLGIGLSALTYSLIDGAVLPTLPVAHGDRIVRIERGERLARAEGDYAAWAARERSFDGLGAVAMRSVTLGIEGRGTEPVQGASITPSILRLLSVEPALGRAFTDEDAAPGAPAVVLLSHDVWRDRLGADAGALGRVVRVNGRPAQVVGIMPDGFGFPWRQQVWSPLDPDPLRSAHAAFAPATESWMVVGRLRQGVSAGAAARELTAITRDADRESGRPEGMRSAVSVRSYTDLFGESGRSAQLAALMLGVALLVLLVACANVANVLLARAIARRREIVIRLALGASRGRILAQLLTEVSLLAALGAAGGVAVAAIGGRYIQGAMAGMGMPYWIAVRIDPSVLGFVALVTVAAALTAGLLPALQASRANTHDLLKDQARGSSSFQLGQLMRRLIGVEMALSFVLLVVAGLFVRSAANFSATDFPFEPEEVYSASIHLPETRYADAAARERFLGEMRETLAGLPQVAGVVLATAVPGVGGSAIAPVVLEGAAAGQDAEGAPRARSIAVTPGFFGLFRASLLAGRDFDARDRAGAARVAVVNEAFAKRYFPKGALDRRVRFAGSEAPEEWLTIVGVTTDLMAGGVEGEIPEAVYLPLVQDPPSELAILARPRGGYGAVPAPVRESLAALDPDVALFDVRALDEVIASANSAWTWFSVVFLVSGGVALFLASLGLYGVMAFWVTQRTREIGVRMALGGQRGDVARLVLGQGMRQISLGLAVGVALAVPAALSLRSALFGVAPLDPIVFGGILGVLLAAAWLGCWLPARRATRIDPLEALTAE